MPFRPGETNILCTHLEVSLRFYRDVLGFEEVEREGPNAVHMRLGGRPFLLLAIARERPTPSPYGRTASISFDLCTNDLPAAIERLRREGVAIDGEPEGAGRMVLIRDPDGLGIEVVQVDA